MIYLKEGKICFDLKAEDAYNISVKQQFEMGLRPFYLDNFAAQMNLIGYKKKFSLSDFSFSYGKGKKVLNITQLQLPKESIIALIGHNGAGKSTFARCLCGLEKRCKGTVTMDGKKYNRKQRLLLCYMVMQDVDHQLFTESVEEEMAISMKESDKKKLKYVLKHLDLESFKKCHPMALSGGQKQRVAIASALVSDREIVIFDEPTSGLDIRHMKEVANELRELRRMKKTSIVITHDYELIVSCCTYVLHLENGMIKQQYRLDDKGIEKLKTSFLETR